MRFLPWASSAGTSLSFHRWGEDPTSSDNKVDLPGDNDDATTTKTTVTTSKTTVTTSRPDKITALTPHRPSTKSDLPGALLQELGYNTVV